MTKAEKRQKNREYYLKRKEELKRRARERYQRLKLVEEGAGQPESTYSDQKKSEADQSTEQPWLKKNDANGHSDQPITTSEGAKSVLLGSWSENFYPRIEMNIQFSESIKPSEFSATKKASVESADSEKSGGPESRLKKISIFFRLLFSVFLTGLLVYLQYEFYRDHDTSQYPLLLAIACELSLVYLAVTKLQSRWVDWIRKMTYGLVFSYVIGSLGFHVFSESRLKAMDNPASLNIAATESTSTQREELIRRLKIAEKALSEATRHGSWDNMEFFGKQVARLRSKVDNLPKEKVLGTTASAMALASGLLLIILRAALVIVNSLNTYSILESFP
jgi:hypothetical protein